MAEALLFYLFGGLALAASFLMVSRRNPVSSAVSLVVTLFAIAVLFLMLQASLVAILQVIVYAGAIMVLFVFVIMLLNLTDEELRPVRFSPFTIVATAMTGGVLYILGRALGETSGVFPEVDASYGTVATIARTLFTTYLLPFEVTSVLLLIAIVGAVVLAKREIES